MDDGRSMRAVKTIPAAPLNAHAVEELSSSHIWPFSPLRFTFYVSRP